MTETGKRKSRAGSPEGGDFSELQAWLDTVPLIDVAPKKQELFQLEHAMTVGRCLEEFSRRKILSAPLVIEPALEDDALDEAGGGSTLLDEGGTALQESAPVLLGWIDTADILNAFLRHLDDYLADEAEGATATATAATATGEQQQPPPSPPPPSSSSPRSGGNGNGNGNNGKKRELPTRMLELMTLLEKLGPSFAARKLITVSGGRDRALVFSATAKSSLLDAMRDLFLPPPPPPQDENEKRRAPSSSSSPSGRRGAGDEGGGASSPRVVHRVAVFDGHGAITAIISQLDVLRFLLRHRERWASSASSTCSPSAAAASASSSDPGAKSIEELGLLSGKAPVLTLDPTVPTLLALKQMKAAGVSGAAVVSPATGTAIANLSISDLRAVDPRHLSVLALPVAELLALLHKTTYVGYSAGGSAAKSHPFFSSSSSSAAAASASRSSSGLRATPVPCSSSSPSRGGATGTGGGGGGATGTGGGGGEVASGGAKETSAASKDDDEAGKGNDDDAAADAAAANNDDDVRFIACTPSTSLVALIDLFLRNGVHRVYVVKDLENPRPEAVVTPTDVFRVLCGVF